MRANKKPKKKWKKAETDFLIENRGKYSYQEFADMLGRSYSVVYDKMHQMKIEYNQEEIDAFEEKSKAQMKEKASGKYTINDRAVISNTVTVVVSDVYHGNREGKKLDDIFIETAQHTNHSVEAVRKVYEENKGYMKVIERQWESYNIPIDRSIEKNHRTGHLTNED